MNKMDMRLAKKKILKCLTEDFKYGKTKTGKPLKRQKQNTAIFDKNGGWQVFNGTDLEMVMDAVVLGLYFALEDGQDDNVEYRQTLEWVLRALDEDMEYERIEEEIRHALAPRAI